MATTDIVFTGFYYAIGYSLSVVICGLDCGNYVVSSVGTITVPINSDANQLCNGAYLAQFDVGPYDHTTYGDATTALTIADGFGGVEIIYVPVVIGFTYPSWGRTLRPISQDEIKSPSGAGVGMTRRMQYFGALLLNTQGIAFGTTTGVYDIAPLDDGAGNVLPLNQLYSGVWSHPVDDESSYDGMIGWTIVRPLPATVVAITGYIDISPR